MVYKLSEGEREEEDEGFFQRQEKESVTVYLQGLFLLDCDWLVNIDRKINFCCLYNIKELFTVLMDLLFI